MRESDGRARGGSGDVPDYGPTTPPDQAGAFIMTEEGVARLFTTYLVDGPFSEHYEPVESPTPNILHEDVPTNPLIRWYDGVQETLANGTDDYPYACTVYRVVEREHFVTSNVPVPRRVDAGLLRRSPVRPCRRRRGSKMVSGSVFGPSAVRWRAWPWSRSGSGRSP